MAARRSFVDYLIAVSERTAVRDGRPSPFGAHAHGAGVNFAVFSRHATRVQLELFDRADAAAPSRVIVLDPARNRTGDVWHTWVEGVRPGQLYGYRVDGPYCPSEGQRFNAHKLLLDPFATAIAPVDDWDFSAARGYDPAAPESDVTLSTLDDTRTTPKCVFTDEAFDWQGDRPLHRPWSDTIIYEVHVRGCTIHPSAGVTAPGTFRGLIEKIPYFRDLGVTAVELMPVAEFNERDQIRINALTGERVTNYWGYNPVAFMAPKASYSSSGGEGQQTLEFREMVRAFHQADIEVVLDVVLNHTAEGNERGPTFSFRGFDNTVFYLLDEEAPQRYRDYTGTGNTVNANHPVVRDILLETLRHWVVEMHVDGFRFDLASVLGRGRNGRLLADPPLLERIAEDPILRGVKLIAEAWDAAGAYQVGSFSERRWAEWNGRYRDDVRRFWRGDPGQLGLLASRLAGSADLYEHTGKSPHSSINFVTAHDGLTLNDLVSYASKHNEANGDGNRDGSDQNESENFGVEGPTGDPAVERARIRQIKNFLVTLFVSRGVPMILGGDEFRRTQGGNNNAYCQDNEISWFDWTLLKRHREVHAFVRGMIRFREAHSVLRADAFYTAAELQWFSPALQPPDWGNAGEQRLGALVAGGDGSDLYLLFNASPAAVRFALPVSQQGIWHLAVDTSREPPEDIRDVGAELALGDGRGYTLPARSSAVLVAHSRHRDSRVRHGQPG
ncbi:MAG TPA: glycogen debranching protein GlgX [Vicinamibacterales bacterium]|nr:glycogen debranching protein GlgX [Vicinamibacterales bacterium]